MRRQLIRYIFTLIVCLAGFAVRSEAQFKEKAFDQTYNDHADTTGTADSAALFSFKEFFGGLAHKNTMKIGTMFAGSVVLPGTAQIYNKDYWKLLSYMEVSALLPEPEDTIITNTARQKSVRPVPDRQE